MKNLLTPSAVLLLALTAVPAQAGPVGGVAPSQLGAVGADPVEQSHGEGAGAQGHDGGFALLKDTPDEEFFTRSFAHLIPHPLFGGSKEALFTFFDTNLFQALAVVLMLIIFTMVKNSFNGSGGGVARVFRGWCHWLRDEVIYSVMGPEDGRRWAPFFLYVFFFIAFMNLLGLLPVIGVTATASYYVTGSLAGITFFCMLFFGFKKQGVVGYFVHLLPQGLPIALIPLMAVVELIGMFIKPFALMVRLFANMLGGHMVVYAFLGMIFLFAKMMDGNVFLSTLTAIPAVGMSVFIMIIEGFISILQAYVFTYLSVIFIHQAMHPAH